MKFQAHGIGHCAMVCDPAFASRICVAFSFISILHLVCQYAQQALPPSPDRPILVLASVQVLLCSIMLAILRTAPGIHFPTLRHVQEIFLYGLGLHSTLHCADYKTLLANFVDKVTQFAKICIARLVRPSYAHIALSGYAPIVAGIGAAMWMILDDMPMAHISLPALLVSACIGVSALRTATRRTRYWQAQAQTLANQLADCQAMAQKRNDDLHSELDCLRKDQQEATGALVARSLSASDLDILAEKRKIPAQELPHFMQFVKSMTGQYACTSISAEVIPFPQKNPAQKKG